MSGINRLSQWLADALHGSSKNTKVTPDTALTYPPIWYAVNKICGHVGQLPLVLHKRLPNGQGAERAPDHPAFRLLKTRPNDWQSAIVFKELMQCHSLLWGNSYAFIQRNGRNPNQLLPLNPGMTAPAMVDGKKFYVHIPEDHDPILRYRKPTQGETVSIEGVVGRHIVFSDDEVYHLPGLGFDGLAGKSLWKVASESWGIGLSSDKRIKSAFDKGFKAAMMLEAPEGVLTKEDEARAFIEDFNKQHSGSENADRVGLLRGGVKANVTAMNSQESQMVEHRRYQRQDAALWFLLESILGDDSSVSYNSLEQKNLAYLSNCLMRWLVKWEEEANRKLLTESEIDQDSHYFKFNVAALLRADSKTTMETLGMGIVHRIINPNQAREKLDMNPYEGGEEYANPAITPGSGADEDDQQENSSNAQASNALRSRVAQLVRVEQKRVTSHTGVANFCDWMEGFYDKWTDKLGDAVEEMGGDRMLAEIHCKESREQLLQCAGDATNADELAAVVGECVSNWDKRVNKLAKVMENV